MASSSALMLSAFQGPSPRLQEARVLLDVAIPAHMALNEAPKAADGYDLAEWLGLD